MFYHDTKKLLAILKELTVDTNDETWMKEKRCGRESMLVFQNHYEGNKRGNAGNRWIRTIKRGYFI